MEDDGKTELPGQADLLPEGVILESGVGAVRAKVQPRLADRHHPGAGLGQISEAGVSAIIQGLSYVHGMDAHAGE